MTVTLERPRAVVRFGPNWFAAAMGTGIVATAAATLPVQPPGLRTAATLGWAVAVVLLVALGVAVLRDFRTYADDPVLVYFWGAPPMALLTVGAGTLLVGRDWIGAPAAVAVDAVLWTIGTVFGLVVAVTVRHRGAAFGGWLMPVVPPMVSAATGALLVPYVPKLWPVCCGLAAFSLVAAVRVMVRLGARLVRDGAGPAALAPTWWIVLGPLGQSVTAARLLAKTAPGPYARVADLVALLYGVPVLGLALIWLAVVAALTARAARAGLPFSPAWWAFTFPLGTVVTGTSGLAARTGSPAVEDLAVLLFAGLVVAWATVAAKAIGHVKKL